jgi:hypothetical protein
MTYEWSEYESLRHNLSRTILAPCISPCHDSAYFSCPVRSFDREAFPEWRLQQLRSSHTLLIMHRLQVYNWMQQLKQPGQRTDPKRSRQLAMTYFQPHQHIHPLFAQAYHGLLSDPV